MTREQALSVLGLKEGATADEIRLAYRELAQMLHPDKFADHKRLRERAEAQMRAINEARDVLLNSSSRGGASSASSSAARAARGRTRSPRDIAFEAQARAHAAETARLTVVSQARTLRERRSGMVTMSIMAALVMLFTFRMSGMIGTLAFSVSSMLVVWGLVDIFTLSNQAGVLTKRAQELARQRDAVAKVAEEASRL